MPFVTVSRQYGSGGSEVAAGVARALGWRLYDNAVVEEVAARLGMTIADVSARDERVPSLVERMASTMLLGDPEATTTVGDMIGASTEARIVEVTRVVMEEAIQAGPVVLVGRGAQCMLASRDDALHVYCYAPFDALVASAIRELDVPPHDAARRVRDMNHQREAYVKRHWQRDWRDLANYDLCINTARLGRDGAAALVTRIARERFGRVSSAP